jgi:hypothetical protein
LSLTSLAVVGTQPRLSRADAGAMLSLQRLDVYQCSIQFLAKYAIRSPVRQYVSPHFNHAV